jgi:hypothetical protein
MKKFKCSGDYLGPGGGPKNETKCITDTTVKQLDVLMFQESNKCNDVIM